MARRFIVKSNDLTVLDNNHIIISGSEVKHIQVLRHNILDVIVINSLECKIEKMTKTTILLEVIGNHQKYGEPNICLTLYMAMLKGDKMDLVVQKAVELGVSKIVPFISNNVVVKLDEKSKEKKRQKLMIVADEACKQCGRTDSVFIDEIRSLSSILKDISNPTIFAYEKSNVSLHETISKLDKENIKNISCIIGPEGGFSTKEAEEISACKNVYEISLGTRILRAETAALNVVSIIMYELER